MSILEKEKNINATEGQEEGVCLLLEVESEKTRNNNKSFIVVDIAKQTLRLLDASTQQLIATYSVSTAKNGIGNMEGTGCTPLGIHSIAQKIGDGAATSTVFVGRVPTGEIYNSELDAQYPKRDWILSRILWLAGCEEGVNKGENEYGVCDTYARYVYIHGTPDTEPMGIPLSHGCIRMRNTDIIDLFDRVDEGTPVFIQAGEQENNNL